MENKSDPSRVKYEQIFETIDLKNRKTKIICTLGYVYKYYYDKIMA